MDRRGTDLAELADRAGARPDGGGVTLAVRRHHARDPVLFWAERDLGVAFGGWALVTAMMLPLGLLFPDAVLLAAGSGALVTWVNFKAFRLEVTAERLRLRPGLIGPARSWPLAAIGTVEVRDDAMRPVRWGGAAPRVGYILIEVPDGLLGIAGIKAPAELAEAIETLRRPRCRSP